MGKHLFRSSPPAKTTPSSSPPHHQTFAESSMEDCIDTVQSFMSKWTSSGSDRGSLSTLSSPDTGFLFSSNSHREAELYVQAVRDLQTTMHRLVSVNPASEKLVRAQNLMQAAMKFLETEFYRILKVNREYLDPECVSVRSSVASRLSTSTSASVSDSEGDGDNNVDGGADDDGYEPRFAGSDSDAMDDLKMIADCMISTGYAKECIRVYKTVRKSIVDETLYNLGVERLSFAQIQKMDWETLEAKIKTWLRAVKSVVRMLFYGERILADHVFSASAAISESAFTEITQEGALTLFGFPENVAKCKKTPEKMFRTLDMYEAISNLFPEIESIFYFDSTAAVRSQVVNSLAKLGEAVRSMIVDFETAIQKDSSKSVVPGGGVHPLVRYVMNYLAFLADYSDSLAAIFENWQLTVPFSLPESLFSGGGGEEAEDEDEYSSPMSVRLAWVILLTLCKIDGKAQPYKDVALSYLFLANNLQYVVGKVRSSNLKLLLGGNWVARHEAKVKQFAGKFEKLGWGKVLTSLPEDPTAEISSEEAKDRFRRFNEEFESAYRKQSSWVVPDPKLRDEIKISLSRKLIPVYSEFFERNKAGLAREYWKESIARFTPEDLGNYLSDLYFGTKGSGSVSSNRSGSGSGSRPSSSGGRGR